MIAYNVQFDDDSATVLYDPEKVTLEALKAAVTAAGYQPRTVRELEQ